MGDGATTGEAGHEPIALVRAHFAALRWTPSPVSVRRQVKVLRGAMTSTLVSDEDLIRHVERCAVERGFSVLFDGHIREPGPEA